MFGGVRALIETYPSVPDPNRSPSRGTPRRKPAFLSYPSILLRFRSLGTRDSPPGMAGPYVPLVAGVCTLRVTLVEGGNCPCMTRVGSGS